MIITKNKVAHDWSAARPGNPSLRLGATPPQMSSSSFLSGQEAENRREGRRREIFVVLIEDIHLLETNKRF